jgi:hypothetical protein
MTLSPARRIHPQTVNVMIESEAFEIIGDADRAKQNLDISDRFDKMSDDHFKNVLQALYQLERENPRLAPELRMLRDEQRKGIEKDDVDGKYARIANRQLLCAIESHAHVQVRIVERMLGARTMRELGDCSGVDGDA